MPLKKDDPELRRLFDFLRREEESEAPSFEQVLEPKRAGLNWFLWKKASLAFLVVLGLGLVLIWTWSSLEPEPERLTFAWESPTDFLLNLPGDQFLSQLPTVGLEEMNTFERTGEDWEELGLDLESPGELESENQ